MAAAGEGLGDESENGEAARVGNETVGQAGARATAV